MVEADDALADERRHFYDLPLVEIPNFQARRIGPEVQIATPVIRV